MNRNQQISRIVFALGIVSVGGLVLVYGYSVLVFQPMPAAWIPWLRRVALGSGILLLGTGAGLLLDRTALLSARILLLYLALWLLTRLPVVVASPFREISWFAVGKSRCLPPAR